MPKIDIAAAPTRFGSAYSPPSDAPCKGLRRWKLGAAAGLTQFGVNFTRIPPGQWTSQSHWHTAEDEFVWVVEGEVVLVSDLGEHVLRAGEAAGFPAGVRDGHHLQNRSDRDAVLLEIGSKRPAEDVCCYPDNGVIVEPGLKVRPYSENPP
jgi:uncharacterized cupin superfamily protein